MTAYAYDAANRLSTVTDWNSHATTYAYDDANRMTTATLPNGVVSTSTYDNANRLYVNDEADRLTSVTPPSLAGPVAQVSGANTSYYYLADGLGSTMATTDASGAIVNSYTYDVYGKTTASSGSQANDFQFAGQQTDPTGLQYLRAKYYDPETGGFLSRDSLASVPGRSGNGFGYAGANPAVNTDPTGNKCFGPVCIDGDGISVGGHEASEGVKSGLGAAQDLTWSGTGHYDLGYRRIWLAVLKK